MASSKRIGKKQRRNVQRGRKKRNARTRSGQPPTTGVRMSDVIRHVAKPLIDEMGDTVEDLERIIAVTIAAWNLTLHASEVQDGQYREIARKHFGSDRESVARFRWICDLVAERRSKFYPHVNVLILDVCFTRESDDSLYFEVLYARMPLTAGASSK